MDQLGFIHDKLDIKILILFVLRRLPAAVDPETLLELCQVDGGIGYFDYSDCISELLQSEHMTEDDEGFRITSLQQLTSIYLFYVRNPELYV